MAISLAVIIILGLGADYLFRRLKLPGLVGMLLVGILVGPYVLGLLRPEMMVVSGDFRKIALIVILLRAGFTLRRETLNRTARPALLMSFVPASFEIAAVSLAAVYLFNFSWLQAAMLGAIIGAVSPAVVVPMMIYFMDQGRGAQKGIPTFVLAGSALDNVFAIVIFTQILSLYQGVKSSILWDLISIPVAVILGTLLGLVAGYLLFLFFRRYRTGQPPAHHHGPGGGHCPYLDRRPGQRPGPHRLPPGGPGHGPGHPGEGREPGAYHLPEAPAPLGLCRTPALRPGGGPGEPQGGLGRRGLPGLAIIGFGLIFRSLGTYLSVLGAGLNWREKLFCILSYIPKATVQAAIGAIPLEAGVPGGELILAMAVLSVLITAPPGGRRHLPVGGASPG